MKTYDDHDLINDFAADDVRAALHDLTADLATPTSELVAAGTALGVTKKRRRTLVQWGAPLAAAAVMAPLAFVAFGGISLPSVGGDGAETAGPQVTVLDPGTPATVPAQPAQAAQPAEPGTEPFSSDEPQDPEPGTTLFTDEEAADPDFVFPTPPPRVTPENTLGAELHALLTGLGTGLVVDHGTTHGTVARGHIQGAAELRDDSGRLFARIAVMPVPKGATIEQLISIQCKGGAPYPPGADCREVPEGTIASGGAEWADKRSGALHKNVGAQLVTPEGVRIDLNIMNYSGQNPSEAASRAELTITPEQAEQVVRSLRWQDHLKRPAL